MDEAKAVFKQAAGFSPDMLRHLLFAAASLLLIIWAIWIVVSIMAAYNEEKITASKAYTKATWTVVFMVVFLFFFAFIGGYL